MTTKNATPLDRVIGWFVVRDDADPSSARAPDERTATAPTHAQGARPNAGVAKPPTRAAAAPAAEMPRVLDAPVVAPGKAHDAQAFAEVYRAAGTAPEEQERVNRVLDLLRALPAGTPLEVRRSIVEASMNAFGISVDRILDTGASLLGALDGYVADGEKRTSEVAAQGEARIARLDAEIAEIRKLIELQRQTQGELVRASASEKARVRAMFEFFGKKAG